MLVRDTENAASWLSGFMVTGSPSERASPVMRPAVASKGTAVSTPSRANRIYPGSA